LTSYHDDTEGWPYRDAPVSAYQDPDEEAEPDVEPEEEPELSLDLAADPEVAQPVTPDPIEPEAEAVLAPAEEEAEPEPAEEPVPDESAAEPVAEQEAPEAEHAVGELDIPDGYGVLEGKPVGGRRTVGIVVGRFNGEITNDLLGSALQELDEAGVERDAVTIMPVPGAFELPLAAMALAKTRRYACVIALGCVIRGETPHFDFVAGEAASGLQLAAVETGVPVSFGVLTCETREQAEARVGKGAEAARAGLEMADLFAQLRAQAR
jgi:6,7-dimethyl-8-ribityllumazine synthase